MRVYGYARVSSRDQNERRQIDALVRHGVPLCNIVLDKLSGKDFDRPGWRGLLGALERGDKLVVCSIDRLGRSYCDIVEVWRELVKVRGVGLCVLDMPLLDTSRTKDLTQTLIADVVLQLLSYVAESERNLIRSRQKEGILAAKRRGVKFGAPKKPIPASFRDVLGYWEQGTLSERAAARRLGVSRATFKRWQSEAASVAQRCS